MRIPVSTYRLQFNTGFRFADAATLVDYLHTLGITDCYASPLSMARPGSVHGYDVVEPTRLNPELGDEQDFAHFARALTERKMGLLLDVVPNHMCVASKDNWRWWDVLGNGPASPYARFFDVDWSPPKSELDGKVLLPVLGEQYGRMLENGISAGYDDEGGFSVCFYETRLPLAPRTWPYVLEPALAELRARFGDEEPRVLELESIIRSIGHLPRRTEITPAKVREGRHEREIIARRLSVLVGRHPDVKGAVERAVSEINGRKGDPRSFDRLETILGEQAYRLAHWRVAADEINYRRFFDINDLGAIRVEDGVVFSVVHELALRLAREGIVTGFRIDHVDGLLDPEKYLNDLQRGYREAVSGNGQACYVVVEKILAEGERLPAEWPVQGTTGYEAIAQVSGLLLDPAGLAPLRKLAASLEDEPNRFSDVVHGCKQLILRTAMSAELNVLARRLDRISEQLRYTRDFTLNSLHEVLAEVIASFPVYRTYIRPGDTTVSERDRWAIDIAVHRAKRRNPVIAESLFDFLRSVLLLERDDGLSDAQRAERQDLVLRFQQLSGPVMAKGLEDTAFYRYFPLAALNEVGGDPDARGVAPDAFHRHMAERARLSPNGLFASATHDTKRGEDTRARLLVLSEMAGAWAEAVGRWRELNRPLHKEVGGVTAPGPAEELLLYQTLVAAWPPGETAPSEEFRGRVREYMRKALLEAKVQTSWINHNEPYEKAVDGFVEAVLDPARSSAFLDELLAVVKTVTRPGYWNSLGQLILKVAAPGVPDFYQGTELWDFSLVDPDNRRQVDYQARRAHLVALQSEAERDLPGLVGRLMAAPDDGRVKMLVMMRALRFRRHHAALFQKAGHEGLAVTGPRLDAVVAFARLHEGRGILAVTGRHFLSLGEGAARPVGAVWGDTRVVLPRNLHGRRWRNVLTDALHEGDTLALREVLGLLPVALLDAA